MLLQESSIGWMFDNKVLINNNIIFTHNTETGELIEVGLMDGYVMDGKTDIAYKFVTLYNNCPTDIEALFEALPTVKLECCEFHTQIPLDVNNNCVECVECEAAVARYYRDVDTINLP